MSDSLQTRKSRTKASKKLKDAPEHSGKLSLEKDVKLKELDSYIETVLENAGEDFLNRFRQIEGE